MIRSLILILLGFGAAAAQIVPVPADLAAYKTVDLDGDGTAEIIYGSEAGCVHVLKKEAGKYREQWSSPLLEGPVVALSVADVDADHEMEIVAATSRGLLFVYGSEAFAEEWNNLHDPLEAVSGMLVADTDGDGKTEMLVYNEDYIFIYEGGSYFREWRSDKGVGGPSVVCGNVDRDPGKEIVTSTGYVIDAEFYRTEWQSDRKFGEKLRLADIDSDGMDELIGIRGSELITIFDLDIRVARIR